MQIAIVGGGATGALCALHLALALRNRAVEIAVIEPADVIGRGVAYATDDHGICSTCVLPTWARSPTSPTICSNGFGAREAGEEWCLQRHFVLFRAGFTALTLPAKAHCHICIVLEGNSLRPGAQAQPFQTTADVADKQKIEEPTDAEQTA